MPVAQTSGFQVSARPSVDFVNPAGIAPAYGNILPSVGQGLALYGGLQQIADEAVARPTRQQLLQIQLQDAQNRLGLAPMERDLKLAQIAEAQQNAAIPHRVLTGREVIGGDATNVYDNNSGEFVVGQDFSPLQVVETGENIGAGGVKTQFRQISTTKPSSQVRAEAERAASLNEATRALARQRDAGKEFESEALIKGYNDALSAAQSAETEEEAADFNREAEMYKSLIDRKAMRPGYLPEGVTGGRELEKMAAHVGIPLDRVGAVAASPYGARALSKLAAIQKYIGTGHSFVPVAMRLSAEEQAAIDGVATVPGPVAAPVAAPSVPVIPGVPPNAVNMLLQNPSLAPQFDAKYGRGTAAKVLTPRG